MRVLLVLPMTMALIGCAQTPYTKAAQNDPNADWCTRNAPACVPLIPFIIMGAVGSGLIDAAPGAAVKTIDETSFGSSTVRTPRGTYDVNSVCTGTVCDSTVRRR